MAMSARDKIRILAADDDPLVRELLCSKLGEDRHEVLAVENGRQALTLLAGDAFDLAIVDLDMPVLDGFTLMRKMRSAPETADIPVIVITGLEDADICARALDAGAAAFVAKPIDWALLSHQVAYVLANARRELALRAALEEAEKAAQLRDNLMRSISHELRTPLNAIIGFAQIINDELYGPLGRAEYKDHAAEIVIAGQALNGMISDTLLASRLLTGSIEAAFAEYDCCEVLGFVVADCRREAEVRGQTIVMDCDGIDLPCDPSLVRDAVRHLLHNAIQYAPNGTEIALLARKSDAGVVLSIEDEGPGMPEARRRELMAHFVQGDHGLTRTSTGLGLGLPIAQAVAELHGGALTLEPRDGGGLRAALHFPSLKARSGALKDAA